MEGAVPQQGVLVSELAAELGMPENAIAVPLAFEDAEAWCNGGNARSSAAPWSVNPTSEILSFSEVQTASDYLSVRKGPSLVTPIIEGEGLPSFPGARPDHETIQRYTIMDRLGGGLAGEVFSVRDAHGALKAMKLFRPSPLSGTPETLLKRVPRELKALIRLGLGHRAIVRFIDHGVTDNVPFLVTDLIEGQRLDVWASEAPFPARIAAIIEILGGLQYAHDQGIFHRDIKPGNLIVRRSDGQAIILDFGLAFLLDELDSTTLTESALGSAGYIPSEVLADPKHRAPTHDVFSTGIVLFEIFSGRKPPDPHNPPLLGELIPEMAGLDPILRRALAAEPTRYQSAKAFADALETFSHAQRSATASIAPRRSKLEEEFGLDSRRPPAEFEVEVVRAIKGGDQVALRLFFEESARVAELGTENGEILGPHLDRLAIVAAASLRFADTGLFERSVSALLRLFGTEDLNAQRQVSLPLARSRLAIAERILALGALSVQDSNWPAAKSLVLRRSRLHPASRLWLFEAKVWGYRYKIIQGGDLVRSAANLVGRVPSLVPSAGGSGDLVLKHLMAFDALALAVSLSEEGIDTPSYVPDFPFLSSSGVAEAYTALISDSAMARALLADPKALPSLLLRVQQIAREVNHPWFVFDDHEVLRKYVAQAGAGAGTST